MRLVESIDPASRIVREEALELEFRSILTTCRNDLVAYRDIVLNGREAIGIHQTRVALRRLRAALSLFRVPLDGRAPRELAEPARRLASACGEARDWDVFLTDTLPQAVSALSKYAEDKDRNRIAERAQALVRTVRRLRRAAHDRARRALSDESYRSFDTLLAARTGGPRIEIADRATAQEAVSHFARSALDARDRKVRKLGKRLDRLSFSEMHDWRVRLKKLRYAASFLRHCFDDSDSRAYIAAASRLQEALGAINDRAMTHDLLERIRETARPAGVHDWLVGALEGWMVGETERREAQTIKAWRRFRRAPRFWHDGEHTE